MTLKGQNKMTNPKTAVDTILDSEKTINGTTVYPMTLARYALLELVESPFVTPNVKFTINNLVPSFFICCSPIDKLKGINSKNLDPKTEKISQKKRQRNYVEWMVNVDSVFRDERTKSID